MKSALILAFALLFNGCLKESKNQTMEDNSSEETSKPVKQEVNSPASVKASVSYPGYPMDKLVPMSKVGTLDWMALTCDSKM